MKHAIIVEDNHESAFILEQQLGKLGYLTTVSNDVFQILESVKNEHVDVITVDIKMHPVSGIDVIKYIREVDKKVKIIVVSTVITNDIKYEALTSGADYYLEKPYTFADLKRLLK